MRWWHRHKVEPDGLVTYRFDDIGDQRMQSGRCRCGQRYVDLTETGRYGRLRATPMWAVLDPSRVVS